MLGSGRRRWSLGPPGSRLPNALAVLFVVVLAVVATHNAFSYPSVSGFDAEPDIEYSRILVEEWRIPSELNNYYTPPGFFLPAGAMVELGNALSLEQPEHLGQFLNAMLTVGTAILLALLCGILFPGRPWLRCAALGLFVTCPVVLKTGAMFHPQPLVAFLAAGAMVLTARMLVQRAYAVRAAVVLGLLAGAGQLVRSVGIWTLGVVGLALLLAAVFRPGERRPAARAFVLVCVIGVLVPLPWYLYLQAKYSSPVFGRSSVPASTDSPGAPAFTVIPGRFAAPAPFRLVAATAGPVLPGTRLRFYVDPELDATFRSPWRQGLGPAFWPILYTETWGDYFGIWKWGSVQKPLSSSVTRELKAQSVVGVLPTLLTAAGLLALVGVALRRVRTQPELLLVPLMVGVALAGTLYYAYSYPTSDGDTVKALFLLPAVPALAVCFGFSVDVIAGRSRRAAVALAVPLALCGLLSLWFGTY